MGISYERLRELMIKNKVKKIDLHKKAGISNQALAKINKDEYMDLETIERIARFLDVDIGDIVKKK